MSPEQLITEGSGGPRGAEGPGSTAPCSSGPSGVRQGPGRWWHPPRLSALLSAVWTAPVPAQGCRAWHRDTNDRPFPEEKRGKQTGSLWSGGSHPENGLPGRSFPLVIMAMRRAPCVMTNSGPALLLELSLASRLPLLLPLPSSQALRPRSQRPVCVRARCCGRTC